MADKSKPYNVKAALDDFHSPDSIAAAIRRSGRPVDSTGVAPHIMRRIMRDIPHVPEAATGPFGTARPPLATDVGMQRPQYTPPMAPHAYAAPTVAADVTRTVPPTPRAPQNAYGALSTLGSAAGGLSSLLAGPAAPLAAIPLSGLGAAAGKGLDYYLNAQDGTEYAPKSAGEVIHGMSGEGLLGMGTELFAAPLNAAVPAAVKWGGNRLLRRGIGLSDDAAAVVERFRTPATKAGSAKLRTHIDAMNGAVAQLAARADVAAGGPTVSAIDVMGPIRDLWFREMDSNVITQAPRTSFAKMWLKHMGRYGPDKKYTFTELLDIKRTADRMRNWNKMARNAKGGLQQQFTNEEEEAAKAVGDHIRQVLNGLPGEVPVPGVSAKPLTIGGIHAIESPALDAERAINATFEPRPMSSQFIPHMVGMAGFGSGHPIAGLAGFAATAAATDPALNSRVALMMSNPALLGSLRGLPANAGRAVTGMYETGRKPQQ